MKTNKHRAPAELFRDRRLIAKYYLQGLTQAEIAGKVNKAQSTVSRDLRTLQGQWRRSAVSDIGKVRAEQLAKIDNLERVYWCAWQRSIENEKSRYGDVRYLQGVQWCIAKRCELFDLDNTEKHTEENVIIIEPPKKTRELIEDQVKTNLLDNGETN